MRESAVEFKHGKLIAGEVNYIHRVTVNAGTYEEGEVLETSDGLTYSKVTDGASIEKEYAVVAQTVTLEEKGEVVCYKEGYFNMSFMLPKNPTADRDALEILKTKRIFITPVKED